MMPRRACTRASAASNSSSAPITWLFSNIEENRFTFALQADVELPLARAALVRKQRRPAGLGYQRQHRIVPELEINARAQMCEQAAAEDRHVNVLFRQHPLERAASFVVGREPAERTDFGLPQLDHAI